MTDSSRVLSWRRAAGRFGATALLAALGLAGCSTASPDRAVSTDSESTGATPSSTPPPAAPTDSADGVPSPGTSAPPDEATGLERTDFGNLEWKFRIGAVAVDLIDVPLVDGAASVEGGAFELGDVIRAELTGDDLMDAAVQITRTEGNGVDQQWYLWVATDAGPVQLTVPISQLSRCGPAVHSVRAVDGGIEVHETRRTIGEEQLNCLELGSDERTRVVSAVETGDLRVPGSTETWWPVQTAPIPGFGGVCPIAAEYETVQYPGALLRVPHPDSERNFAGEGPTNAFILTPWDVYEAASTGWMLLGVYENDVMSCAWAERE